MANVTETMQSLGLSGAYWRGVVEMALTGSVDRAIQIAEHTAPKYTWSLKERRACLTHSQMPSKDIDWVGGSSTAAALVTACQAARGQ